MSNQRRIGIIDIGSNSIRLVIYEQLSPNSHHIIDESKESAKLSSRVSSDGTIPVEAIMKIVDILNHFKTLCAVHHTNDIRAVATAAIRNARNRDKILTLLHEHTGLYIKCISGEEEARYGFIGVVNTIPVRDAFLIDTGGGSTEITLIKNRKLINSVSLPIGAVNTASRYASQGMLSAEQEMQVIHAVQQQLRKVNWIQENQGLCVVGLGGTFRSIAKINQQRTGYSLDSTHHYTMGPEVLDQMYDMLAPLSMDQLKKINGLSKDRADNIKCGITILRTILNDMKAPLITISGSGLRDGLFFEATNPASPILPDVLEYSIQNLLTLNPYASRQHLKQVNRLSLMLFDSLSNKYALPDAYRKYMHTASCLYRLGVSIHYYDYQAHTFYMMTHSRIDGLTHREILLCALIASYKSKRRCKKLAATHSDILTIEDIQIATKLGSLLQLAIALDRSETQPVVDMQISIENGELTLGLHTRHSPSIELKAVNAVEKEFKKTWALTLSTNVVQPT